MKRCLLVGAAPSAHKELDYILQTQGFDAVYAVDGGFAALQERGIVPDAVFGDFDSLGAVPQHPCVFEYDMHKDFTDMDLAIGHAEQQGLEELVICDAFTGRLDHSLGSLQLLIQTAARGTCVWGIGEETVIARWWHQGRSALFHLRKVRKARVRCFPIAMCAKALLKWAWSGSSAAQPARTGRCGVYPTSLLAGLPASAWKKARCGLSSPLWNSRARRIPIYEYNNVTT